MYSLFESSEGDMRAIGLAHSAVEGTLVDGGGLIERRFPGKEKSGRQVTMSTDLIYDVLRRHQPDHILLRAAREDAASGLLDLARLADMLARVQGHIVHKDLDRISPLAVPVMLEIGREPVYGEAQDEILAEAAAMLAEEAGAS